MEIRIPIFSKVNLRFLALDSAAQTSTAYWPRQFSETVAKKLVTKIHYSYSRILSLYRFDLGKEMSTSIDKKHSPAIADETDSNLEFRSCTWPLDF